MSRKRGTTTSWSLVAGAGVAGLIVGYLIGTAGGERPAEPTPGETPRIAVRRPIADPAPAPPSVSEPAPPVIDDLPPIPAGEGARVALVIDDLGRRVQDVVELSALGVDLSFGVLPFESRTAEVIAELQRRGAEILLHLPMQPLTEADPGPGALTTGMSASELEAATRWALGAVEVASGVNNHMGSELSADAARMRTILGVLAERDLFYLDSRTSPESVGYRLALEMGMAAAERQVFLDPDADPAAIRRQFRRLLAVARERGSAVAIGHPHAETLSVLREEVPLALAAGFEFVPVSALTRRGATAGVRTAQSERSTSTGLD